jgi:hypothetical protein
MHTSRAAMGSAAFFVVTPDTVVGLIPWLITRVGGRHHQGLLFGSLGNERARTHHLLDHQGRHPSSPDLDATAPQAQLSWHDLCWRGGRVGRAVASGTSARRGKSGLLRAGWLLTATRGDPRDSATENKPPRTSGVRVKRRCKRPPASRVTGAAW